MSAGPGVLLDGRRHPSLRLVVGRLLSRARHADFAIASVRLAAVDLTRDELAGVQRCRVLLGRLDVDALAPAEGAVTRVRPIGDESNAASASRLAPLREFMASGRIAIRTAGSPLWLPDFSILSGLPEQDGVPGGGVCVVGAHYFARPYPTRGPAMTCLLSGRDAVTCARERFDELWELGYDVLPVIAETIDALLS
jgi:hypothetical protein